MREGDTCWNPEHAARWLLPESYSRRAPRVPFLSPPRPPACLLREVAQVGSSSPPFLSGNREPFAKAADLSPPPKGCTADKQPSSRDQPCAPLVRLRGIRGGGGRKKDDLKEFVVAPASPGSCCKTCRGRGVRPPPRAPDHLPSQLWRSRALPWSAGDAVRRASYPLVSNPGLFTSSAAAAAVFDRNLEGANSAASPMSRLGALGCPRGAEALALSASS